MEDNKDKKDGEEEQQKVEMYGLVEDKGWDELIWQNKAN